MNHLTRNLLLGSLAFAFCSGALAETKLVKTEAGWQLLRDGKPYQIHGAGGAASKQMLKDAGGNSFRTWDAQNIGDQLDEAQKLGLSVTVGIWLKHERHGFSYNDPKFVAEQFDTVRKQVTQYKDHPAILMWALGNEMEGEKGDNAAVWSHIQACAAMVKSIDPTRPTMTVVAEIAGDKIANIHKLCPDIDIIGVNSYAGASSLVERYKAAGGTKPLVITEFGPFGTWEVERNAFGALPEPTANQKADIYKQHYNATVGNHKDLVLGSYAFKWGTKLEFTYTWFCMLLPDGSKLPAVDAMTQLWTGSPPANRCPVIQPLGLSSSQIVQPGSAFTASVSATDPENDPLTYEWVLTAEVKKPGIGGDPEAEPAAFPSAIQSPKASETQITMPAEPGLYRLYAYVRDNKGSATTANLPILVQGKTSEKAAPNNNLDANLDAKLVPGRKAAFPFDIFTDAGQPSFYAASGWMGNIPAIKNDMNNAENPHSGKTAVRVDYAAVDKFGGVVWQDPVNDWGDLDGGFDLTGATRLRFFAKGAAGGETVQFKFGVLGAEKNFRDSDSGLLVVQLTDQWKEYAIDLAGKDLRRIKTGFVWVVEGQGKPVTFFLDDIQYVKD